MDVYGRWRTVCAARSQWLPWHAVAYKCLAGKGSVSGTTEQEGPSPVGQVSKMAATARHQDSGGGGGKRQGAGQDAGSRRRHRLLGQYAAERSSPCVVSARTGLPVSPTLSSVPSPDAGIAHADQTLPGGPSPLRMSGSLRIDPI